MRKSRIIWSSLVILSVFAISAGADEIWNETGNGALSSNQAVPTVVTLVSLSDLIVGDGSMGVKYFTFNVPAGESVNSVIVDPGQGGIMTANVWLFSNNASSPANCGEYTVLAQTELLGAPNCAPSLTAGDHTIGLNVVTSTPWAVTISSTVPIELQTFAID